MNNIFKLLSCGALTVAFSTPAFADPYWTLTGTLQNGLKSVEAYANTGGDTAAKHANNGLLGTIAVADKFSYSGGLGIRNKDYCSNVVNCDANETTSPEHAIDNNQRFEMLLLTFSAPVRLTGLQIGWKQNDSDMTVLAFDKTKGVPNITPGTTPAEKNAQTFAGLKYDQLVSKGWIGIGHFANVPTGTEYALTGAPVVYSSYWLIGAYNPLTSSPYSLAGGPLSWGSGYYDYVKLTKVYGLTVPEPSSLALTGLGMAGLLAMRRRKSLVAA